MLGVMLWGILLVLGGTTRLYPHVSERKLLYRSHGVVFSCRSTSQRGRPLVCSGAAVLTRVSAAVGPCGKNGNGTSATYGDFVSVLALLQSSSCDVLLAIHESFCSGSGRLLLGPLPLRSWTG
ncbi:hypothetical protein C8Q77DRAFT_268153 [Trametes polyzona]|nr:hypothetical protein C8Q77DRAFT_268153 [Trametes polyzona]